MKLYTLSLATLCMTAACRDFYIDTDVGDVIALEASDGTPLGDARIEQDAADEANADVVLATDQSPDAMQAQDAVDPPDASSAEDAQPADAGCPAEQSLCLANFLCGPNTIDDHACGPCASTCSMWSLACIQMTTGHIGCCGPLPGISTCNPASCHTPNECHVRGGQAYCCDPRSG